VLGDALLSLISNLRATPSTRSTNANSVVSINNVSCYVSSTSSSLALPRDTLILTYQSLLRLEDMSLGSRFNGTARIMPTVQVGGFIPQLTSRGLSAVTS